MPTQPRSQCSFFKRRGIDWRRKTISCSALGKNPCELRRCPLRPWEYATLSAMSECVQKCSKLLKWDLVIQEIQPLTCRKKLILICELGCVRGNYVFQNSVSLTRLQLLVLNSRLLYQASLPYVKFSDRCLIAHEFGSRHNLAFSCAIQAASPVWLSSKKRIKVLVIGNLFLD